MTHPSEEMRRVQRSLREMELIEGGMEPEAAKAQALEEEAEGDSVPGAALGLKAPPADLRDIRKELIRMRMGAPKPHPATLAAMIFSGAVAAFQILDQVDAELKERSAEKAEGGAS